MYMYMCIYIPYIYACTMHNKRYPDFAFAAEAPNQEPSFLAYFAPHFYSLSPHFCLLVKTV